MTRESGTTPFVIIADLRTGSTLLSTSLEQHPEVRCYGELFHPDEFPDNRPPGPRRQERTGRELIEAVFSETGVRASGFRAMIFLPMPTEPQWGDVWESLRDTDGLRTIYLTRRDRLAQYASIVVASQTQVWHPSPDHPVLLPENRPTFAIDPHAFERWMDERDALMAQRRNILKEHAALDLEYESLTTGWTAVMDRVQQFLGVTRLPLVQAKEKQEKRPLSQVIANYEQLRAIAR